MIRDNSTIGTGIKKHRLILWAAIAALLAWHGLQVMQAAGAGAIPLYDFIEYWSAGRIFLQGGNPYDEAEMLACQRGIGWDRTSPIMMWNPPWAFIFVLPFALMPYWTGRALWFLASLLLLFWSVDWLYRYYGGGPRWRWLSWITVIIFFPVLSTLYLGQITPLALAGVAAFLQAERGGRYTLAGASVLLLSVKPHLLYLFWVFLVFWILKEKRWSVLAGAWAALSIGALVVALVNHSAWVNYFQVFGTGPGPLIWQTPTWGVALMMLFPQTGQLLRFLPSLAGLLATLYFWRRWSHGFAWRSALPPIVLLCVISNSFTWMFDWVVLLLPVVQAVVWFQADGRRRWWIPMTLLLTQAALIFQPAVAQSNFYTIWLPVSLAALYLTARRVCSRQQEIPC